MSVAHLRLADFDYTLPEALIARFPLPTRSASRLLSVNGTTLCDHHFSDLPTLLQAGDLLVLNDTKVMKARLFGHKASGGQIELLVERLLSPTTALCHIRASKSPKTASLLIVNGQILRVLGREQNLFVVAFDTDILDFLAQFGELPIPPYFVRKAETLDETRYQTVFFDPSKQASVAAPTASLHFDNALLDTLRAKGVNIAFVTLHVGAGTFAPIKTDDISAHTMHKEYAELPQVTADAINRTKAQGGRVVAVGTTVTRVLESAFQQTASHSAPKLSAWMGDTDIFIYPPYRFGVVDLLITNFHLPKSTLLLLVSAFAGVPTIQRAYQHAIDAQYRFFSYGDAMLLTRQQ